MKERLPSGSSDAKRGVKPEREEPKQAWATTFQREKIKEGERGPTSRRWAQIVLRQRGWMWDRWSKKCKKWETEGGGGTKTT